MSLKVCRWKLSAHWNCSTASVYPLSLLCFWQWARSCIGKDCKNVLQNGLWGWFWSHWVVKIKSSSILHFKVSHNVYKVGILSWGPDLSDYFCSSSTHCFLPTLSILKYSCSQPNHQYTSSMSMLTLNQLDCTCLIS